MKYILFLGIICSGFVMHGQYAKAFVNKGVVKINGKFEFKEGSSFDVRPNQKMNLNANTILTCKRDQKVCSFSGYQTVTYNQVMSTLDKSKTKSTGYFENMFSGNYQVKKPGYGGVGRDISGTVGDDYYYPTDSMLVLSDMVVLTIGNGKTNILGPFFMRGPKGEVKQLNQEGKNSIQVKISAPGEYHWGCDISVNGEELSFDNVFFVPDPKQKKSIQRAYKRFVKSLKSDDGSWVEMMKINWRSDHQIIL